jgi:uncharacterized PurR-regulated membrane protein YhhQ (DUF165 family)
VSKLSLFELGLIAVCESLVVVTLAGLVARRHITNCWAFALYLLAVLATDTAMLFDRFDTLAFWMLKEISLNALKFAIAFELMTRAFARFPGARATAQRAMRLVLVLTLVTLVWVAAAWQVDPTGMSSREVAARIAGEFQPRLVTAATWLFVAIAGLILWYRLPVESMAKAILIGFVPYLIFSYMVLQLRNANQWPTGGWMPGLDAWAWPILMLYWARSAWQPFREIIPGRRPVPAVQGSAG